MTLAEPLTGTKALVIGAGPLGLFAADELQAAGVTVDVVHNGPLTFAHDTGVAAIAAGLVEPVATSEEDAPLVDVLCRDSLAHWMTADARAGVDRRSVLFRPAKTGTPSWVRGMPHATALADGNWRFRTAVVTSKIWLPQQVRRLRARGVSLRRREVTDLVQEARSYDLVVNASGPGAWQLGDERMFGSRAVLVWAKAPVSEVRFDDDRFLYGIPQREYVAFGGTAIPIHGDPRTWDRTPQPDEVKRILDGAHSLYPELGRIEPLQVTCNYRPCRDRLRIEVEYLAGTPVLHLTGFAGSGWTLAPAAAHHGISLVKAQFGSREQTRRATA